MTPWTVVCQAPLSLGFFKQEYWLGLPFPPPGDLPNPGIVITSPGSPALAGRFSATEPPGKPMTCLRSHKQKLEPKADPLTARSGHFSLLAFFAKTVESLLKVSPRTKRINENWLLFQSGQRVNLSVTSERRTAHTIKKSGKVDSFLQFSHHYYSANIICVHSIWFLRIHHVSKPR